MKLTTSVLILALTGTALAQAPAVNKNATPAAKPVAAPANSKPAQAAPAKPVQAAAAKPVTTAAKQGASTATKSGTPTPAKPATAAAKPVTAPVRPVMAKPVTVKPAVKPAVKAAAVKPVKPVVKKVEKKAEAAPEKPAEEKKPTDVVANAKNRRDPFVSIVMNREGAPCSGGGKKCIAIDQVTLQGVVRAPSGPIAVISSGANKTYFLRENDPVYNGVVVKISPDSIVFRETVIDRVGKTSQREVVKKIRNTPA